MAALVAEAYAGYVDRIGKPPGPMLDDYATVVRARDAYVAELEGRIVGVLVLLHDAQRVLLDNVAVDPTLRGQGLGRALVSFAESRARCAGHGAIEIYTHELMTENIALYRRAGYEEIARRRERGYARVYMRKLLR